MINNLGASILNLSQVELDVKICQQINGHFYLLICKYYISFGQLKTIIIHTHRHTHTHTHTTHNMITVPFRLKIIITTPQSENYSGCGWSREPGLRTVRSTRLLFSPFKMQKPFLIYQLGTNNWQREGEFAPGSGILHEGKITL